MKNGKRSLAMILCLTMLMSTILVFPVHAATYSGSCGAEGDNVQWSLDTTTGLLSITGTGAMNNYSSIGNVPWNSRHSSVKTVTIANGVTSISNYAFWDCTRLTSITIPDSVTRIGNSAFYGCTNLQYNTYENAKYLGNASNPYFALIEASDPGIKSCTIHPDAKLIAGSAFNCCSDLTEIVIPDGVKSIGPGAFFSCTGLKRITIPDSITGIENETFWYCVGLTNITIPGSVTRIGVDAFSDCKGLTSIYYKGTQEQWNQVSKDNSGITDHGVVYYNSCNDAATHTYDNACDTTCHVCGNVRTVTHTYSGDCDTTCEICGYEREVTAEHTYTGDCDTTCDVCGYVRKTTAEHQFRPKWSSDENEHWHECRNCGERVDEYPHTYDNDCDTTCNVCGYVRTITHKGSAWSADETQHWHTCTVCGEQTDIAEHAYDNACDATCNVCGYVRSVEHDYSSDWVYDEAAHWRACTECGARTAIGDHVYDNDCDTACNVCGAVREVPGHVYDNDCDATCNICGAVRVAPHQYSKVWSADIVCHWHDCIACGVRTDICEHTYDANGVCTVCGYEAVAQLGDLNGNGEIDSNDAALLRTHFLTWGGSAGEEAVLAVCDINGNGKVDSNDYVLIRMKVLGLIEAFPRADS